MKKENKNCEKFSGSIKNKLVSTSRVATDDFIAQICIGKKGYIIFISGYLAYTLSNFRSCITLSLEQYLSNRLQDKAFLGM